MAEQSKKIKKDKKSDGKKKAEARESAEEGEEGMVSDGSASEDADSDADDHPTDSKLIEKYEKYPEYLKITFKKPQDVSSFFENVAPFNSANRHAISSILSQKSKDSIADKCFPLSFYIQLIPALNVITIMAQAPPLEGFSGLTDSLLTNLTIVEKDEGSQLMIDELSQIQSLTQERLYKWLHSLAGLVLPFSATEHSLGKSPLFSTSTDLVVTHAELSTKGLINRIWQRSFSQQLLYL